VATLVSFVGILLIVKPEAIFGQASSIDMVCCLILLVGALLNSVNMVLLRMLRSRATNDTCLQYFYIGQIISNSLIMLTKGKPIAE
jgi:drug/metabolite transporter (DMT)-like permease